MKVRAGTEQIRRFLKEGLWSEEPASRWIVARAVSLLQFAIMTAEGFVRDRLLLHASALTYFTVISLIPVIAIVVSIAAAIGIESDFAEGLVEKLAAGAPGLQEKIVSQIKAADFKALGGIGAAIVFVLTVLGLSNVEGAFNSIWGVKKHRAWGRRFPDYLAILVVVPLMATGLSLATGLQSEWLVQRLLEYEVFSRVYQMGLQQLPWLTLTGSLALMFWFLPNTSVRFSSALLGGAVSALLILFAQDLYLGFSVGAARGPRARWRVCAVAVALRLDLRVLGGRTLRCRASLRPSEPGLLPFGIARLLGGSRRAGGDRTARCAADRARLR